MRKFLFGAVYTLLAYLDGKAYKNHAVIADIHEICKQEFNGDMIFLKDKPYRIGKSTKGNLADYIEKVIVFMEEQYAVDRTKALLPANFKKWRDEIFPYGGPDNYIDYLKEQGNLPLSTLAN